VWPPLDPKPFATYWLGCLYGGPLCGFMLAALAYHGLTGSDQQGIGEILHGSLPEADATSPHAVADRQAVTDVPAKEKPRRSGASRQVREARPT
jgi:hypothetical protein